MAHYHWYYKNSKLQQKRKEKWHCDVCNVDGLGAKLNKNIVIAIELRSE